MAPDSLSDDIRELVVKCIDSVAQLEALLFLRDHSGLGFDVASLARHLFASESAVEVALARLQSDGFIKQEKGTFRYDASPELNEKVDRLAASYRKHLVPITNLIHSKPGAARSFSDAFRFRKE
jgi:predicted transcriptional regulator